MADDSRKLLVLARLRRHVLAGAVRRRRIGYVGRLMNGDGGQMGVRKNV